MYKLFSLVTPIALAISSTAYSQQPTINEICSAQDTIKKKSNYNLQTYATYLGLNLEQYGRFHAAISGRSEAINLGSGFELKKHPAFIQAAMISSQNEAIPQALLVELEDTLTSYNKGMAEYVGVSIKKFESISKKFANLAIMLDDLAIASVSQNKIPNISNMANVQSDVIERIIITADESSIPDTSRGFGALTFAIHNEAIGRMSSGQISGTFTVDFVATDSNFEGSQTWRVTNTYAWPVDAIKVKDDTPYLN